MTYLELMGAVLIGCRDILAWIGAGFAVMIVIVEIRERRLKRRILREEYGAGRYGD